jgi:hypothetical protein
MKALIGTPPPFAICFACFCFTGKRGGCAKHRELADMNKKCSTYCSKVNRHRNQYARAKNQKSKYEPKLKAKRSYESQNKEHTMCHSGLADGTPAFDIVTILVVKPPAQPVPAVLLVCVVVVTVAHNVATPSTSSELNANVIDDFFLPCHLHFAPIQLLCLPGTARFRSAAFFYPSSIFMFSKELWQATALSISSPHRRKDDRDGRGDTTTTVVMGGSTPYMGRAAFPYPACIIHCG